ncbi:monooxygenase [Pusillimonas sp.]|uniref:monooxygenase n=1 Tax=Pusillimonas sp. TaxID=3040095 RepID=UPI0037C6F57A
MKILQVDFPSPGPFGAEMSKAMQGLAESIANEPGLVWKLWTENAETGEAGGIYCFENLETLNAYKDMHSARLADMGVTDLRIKVFDANIPLSKVDRFPGL